VALTKTPVVAVYPLSQPRLFNGRPTELRIETGGGKCEDGEFSREPTCGWAKKTDANGVAQDVVYVGGPPIFGIFIFRGCYFDYVCLASNEPRYWHA